DRLEAKLHDGKKAEKVEPPRPKPTFPPAPLPSFVKAVEVQAAEDVPAALPVDKPTTPEGVPSPRNVPMGESVSPPRSPEEPNKPRGRQTPQGLEQAIGLKWAGWIGAIVLAIGAGLGIKFAYEQGWFGHLPVEVRLFLMSLGGFALLAAGEVVYRRINVISAAALFGAGVTVLFLISY